MFLGRVSNWSSVTGTDVPFTTIRNTNCKLSNNNGLITFNKAGNYNLDGALVVSGIAGNVTATVYADGVATSNVVTVSLAETTDYGVIPIVDAINVTKAQYPSVGTISIRMSAGATVNGNLRIEYLQ